VQKAPPPHGGISTVHNTTDTIKLDKMGETARTMYRTTQKPAHTAMDHALRAQEVNTDLLRRTSQAWIEGFRYQARLSQGMAQMFFGQWRAAFRSMPHVDLPGQEHSGPEVIEPATNGAQKVTEPAAKDVQKDIEKIEKVAREKKATEVAAKDAQKKAEKQKAEKVAREKQRAEKVARETRKAEEAAEETQKKTEIAAESARKSAEPAAEETQKSTEVAAKDAQKNIETAAFPVDGYDEMNVGEVSERLDDLSANELKRVRKYEKDNKDRGSLRKEINQKIKTTS
jgi:outer membrane biosynthesis protein TonB